MTKEELCAVSSEHRLSTARLQWTVSKHQPDLATAELKKGKPVSPEELMLTTLAMMDALTKLLIEKGVITDPKFRQKLFEERAVYQRILNPMNGFLLG